MKILIVHNFYKSSAPSGEDGVFWVERELLQSNGIDVITFEKHNDDITRFSNHEKFFLPFSLFWSRKTYNQLRTLIEKEKPDVAHFHNIWYLTSPSAYYACQAARVPVVQTLHNFRFFCSNGLLMNNGRLCEGCVNKLPWRAIAYGCYRGSRLYSIPIALMQSFHRGIGTWWDKIDSYIALTEFSKKKFVECGLPAKKIFVKPNFLPNPPDPSYTHDGYGVFLGRLSIEKGLYILADAFKMLQTRSIVPLSLKIVGDGPLRKQLSDKIRYEKIPNLELIGRKNPSECMKLLRRARFMVMPSIWYEGFPMAVREAFACGKLVIASRLGALAELVEDGKTGLLFEPGNAQDLASKIKWTLENESACVEMGKNARRVFEEKYTAENNYKMLMKIYHSILGTH